MLFLWSFGLTFFFWVHSFVAVAKALRGTAKGKAVVQAVADEWKQKYELERSKNLDLLRQGWFSSN